MAQAAQEAEVLQAEIDALRAAASIRPAPASQSGLPGWAETAADGGIPVTISLEGAVQTLGVWTEPEGFAQTGARSDPFERAYALPGSESLALATVEALPGPMETFFAAESGLPMTWTDENGAHTCFIQDAPDGGEPALVTRTLKWLIPAGDAVLRVSVQSKPLPANELPTPEALLSVAGGLFGAFTPAF